APAGSAAGERARVGDDAVAGLGEEGVVRRERDAELPDGARPEAVAGQYRDGVPLEKALRKRLRGEPRAPNVEKHEHPALGRRDAAARGCGEDAREETRAAPVVLAKSRDLRQLLRQRRERAFLREKRA